jgi:hypothetical protein
MNSQLIITCCIRLLFKNRTKVPIDINCFLKLFNRLFYLKCPRSTLLEVLCELKDYVQLDREESFITRISDDICSINPPKVSGMNAKQIYDAAKSSCLVRLCAKRRDKCAAILSRNSFLTRSMRKFYSTTRKGSTTDSLTTYCIKRKCSNACENLHVHETRRPKGLCRYWSASHNVNKCPFSHPSVDMEDDNFLSL